MPQQHSDKPPVTFGDVAAYFSEEEWKLLHEWQKQIYRNVMNEIRQVLSSLGPLIATSVFSLRANVKKDTKSFNQEDAERRHSIPEYPGNEVMTSVAFSVKEEGDVYYVAHQEAGRKETICTTIDTAVVVNCEGQPGHTEEEPSENIEKELLTANITKNDGSFSSEELDNMIQRTDITHETCTNLESPNTFSEYVEEKHVLVSSLGETSVIPNSLKGEIGTSMREKNISNKAMKTKGNLIVVNCEGQPGHAEKEASKNTEKELELLTANITKNDGSFSSEELDNMMQRTDITHESCTSLESPITFSEYVEEKHYLVSSLGETSVMPNSLKGEIGTSMRGKNISNKAMKTKDSN